MCACLCLCEHMCAGECVHVEARDIRCLLQLFLYFIAYVFLARSSLTWLLGIQKDARDLPVSTSQCLKSHSNSYGCVRIEIRSSCLDHKHFDNGAMC